MNMSARKPVFMFFGGRVEFVDRVSGTLFDEIIVEDVMAIDEITGRAALLRMGWDYLTHNPYERDAYPRIAVMYELDDKGEVLAYLNDQHEQALLKYDTEKLPTKKEEDRQVSKKRRQKARRRKAAYAKKLIKRVRGQCDNVSTFANYWKGLTTVNVKTEKIV